MAASYLDVQEEVTETDFLDSSLSVWKGKAIACYESDDFVPVPLDLHTACSIGYSNVVNSIIARGGVELDRVNRGGWTALMYACYIGHVAVVCQLLEAGAHVNTVNNKGQTPLALAASCGNEQVSEHLLQQGADLGVRDKKGWTALFHATYSGHQNMVKFLVDNGADINVSEPVHGMTVLMEAAVAGHEITVQYLLQHGANVFAKSHCGDTAVSLAIFNGHMKIAHVLNTYMNSVKCNLVSEPDITEGPIAFGLFMKQANTHLGTGGLLPRGKHSGVRHHDVNKVCFNDVGERSVLTAIDDDDDEENAFTQIGALTIKGSFGSGTGLVSLVDTQTHDEYQQLQPQCILPPATNQSQQDLHSFLRDLGLAKYAAIFDEQDVDFPMFLTLTDDDLKEIGIKLFGPRRKMTTAIARWNNSANPPSAFPDPRSYQTGDELERVRSQLQQERQLRAVTEVCLMEDRLSWQQITAVAAETLQKCDAMREGLTLISRYHDELKHREDLDRDPTYEWTSLSHALTEGLTSETCHANVSNMPNAEIFCKLENVRRELELNVTGVAVSMNKLMKPGLTFSS